MIVGLCRSGPPHHGGSKKMKRKLQGEINGVSTVGNVKKDATAKRSNDYIVDHDSNSSKSIHNRHFNDRVGPTPTPSIKRKRITDLDELTMNSIEQSFVRANASIRLDQQQGDFENEADPNDRRLQPQNSSFTANSVTKHTSFVDINRDNLSQKSVPLEYVRKTTMVMSPEKFATLQYVPKATSMPSLDTFTGFQYVPKATIQSSPEKMPPLHYVPKATIDSLPKKLPPLHYVPKTTPVSSTEKLPTLHYVPKTAPTSAPETSTSINYVPKAMSIVSSDTSTTLQYVSKGSPMSSPRVHGVKVSRKRMGISPRPLATIPSESIDPAAQGQGPFDNTSNHYNAFNSISNQTASKHTLRTIVVNLDNSSATPTYYTLPSKRKHDDADGGPRTSSFNQVSVEKVSPMDDRSMIIHTNVSVNHHKSNQVGTIDGVIITPLRKKK